MTDSSRSRRTRPPAIEAEPTDTKSRRSRLRVAPQCEFAATMQLIFLTAKARLSCQFFKNILKTLPFWRRKSGAACRILLTNAIRGVCTHGRWEVGGDSELVCAAAEMRQSVPQGQSQPDTPLSEGRGQMPARDW